LTVIASEALNRMVDRAERSNLKRLLRRYAPRNDNFPFAAHEGEDLIWML
jgi:hypothetical protein